MTTSLHNAQILLEKIQSLPINRIAEIEDFVDFLCDRAAAQRNTIKKGLMDFPVDDLGPWPENLSLHREDIYGDDGR